MKLSGLLMEAYLGSHIVNGKTHNLQVALMHLLNFIDSKSKQSLLLIQPVRKPNPLTTTNKTPSNMLNHTLIKRVG